MRPCRRSLTKVHFLQTGALRLDRWRHAKSKQFEFPHGVASRMHGRVDGNGNGWFSRAQ